jgi:hypothetical protein
MLLRGHATIGHVAAVVIVDVHPARSMFLHLFNALLTLTQFPYKSKVRNRGS